MRTIEKIKYPKDNRLFAKILMKSTNMIIINEKFVYVTELRPLTARFRYISAANSLRKLSSFF